MRVLAIASIVAGGAGCGLALAGTMDAPPPAGDELDAAPDTTESPGDDAGDGGAGDEPDAAVSDAADARDASAPPDTGAADAAPDAGPLHASNALAFNGTTGFVDVGALAIPTDFTVEAWVRPAAFLSEQLIVGKDRSGTSQSQFRFGLVAGGRPFFLMTDAQGNDHGLYNGVYVVEGPSAVAANVWTHVAVTKSGKAFSLVVAGVSVVTANADASFTHGGSQPFRIAARLASDGVSPASFFDGTIDEVRVWDVGRTAAQIAADMSHAITPSHPQYASLVGYWRFDEGAGTSAADQIGAHVGSLVGAPTWVPSDAF